LPHNTRLEEVTEVPIPKNAVQNTYRRSRLLLKGCPKLIKLVDKYHSNLERSLAETQKYSERLMSCRDRIKLSIMETRSNALKTPKMADNSEEPMSDTLSGLNTSTPNASMQKKYLRTQKKYT